MTPGEPPSLLTSSLAETIPAAPTGPTDDSAIGRRFPTRVGRSRTLVGRRPFLRLRGATAAEEGL